MILVHLLRLTLLVSSIINVGKGGSWWNLIPEELRLIFSLTFFFVELLVLAGVFYLAGLIVVGGKRARLTDAFIISLVGTVLSTLFFMFIPYPLLALILSIFVWLILIKDLFDTGWLGAIGVGLLAVIIFVAIVIILAMIFGIIETFIEYWKFLLPSAISFT